VEQILTPFSLEFYISDYRQNATLSDLEELESLTSEYLRTHFFGTSSTDNIIIHDFFTEMVTNEDSPEALSATVSFRSTSVSDPDSQKMIPTQIELEDELERAVSGEDLNGFLGMVQAFPSRNMFSSTTQIAFLGYDYDAETVSHTVIIPLSKSSIASVVWACVMVALATSLVSLAFYFRLYDRRRHASNNNKKELANLVELKAAPRTETLSSVTRSGGDITEDDDDEDSRLSECLPFRDQAPKTNHPNATNS
jgi:hypothetical protein